MHGNAVAAQAI